MTRIKKILFAKWFYSLIGIISLSVFIWFIGPLIAVSDKVLLANSYVRIGLIVVVFMIWGLLNLKVNLKQTAKREEPLEELIVEDDSETVNEVALLKDRLDAAIKTVSKKKALKDIPWYMMIGAPGAGKSSVISHSGLTFPLRNKGESGFVDGIGGTSHCDWWFSEQCVFLDTAGRYTTQDSNVNVDSKSWNGLLGLLRKYRTGRPINGVIVTISLASLINQTKSERSILARDIKARIYELRNKLGLHFPIYVMLTKLDLIDGFNEFFDELTEQERQEYLGFVLPDDSMIEEDKMSLFNKEFHDLVVKLDQRMLANLYSKPSQRERNLAFQFPKQLRSIQAQLDDLLQTIFSENKFEEPLMIRGVFLTSTTQEGSPVSALSNATHAIQQRRGHHISQNLRESVSYFVKGIFDTVILKESLISGIDARKRRKLNFVSRSSFAISLITLLSLSYWWIDGYQSGIAKAQHIDQQAELVETSLNTLEDFESDIRQSITVLNRLSLLTQGIHQDEIEHQWAEKISVQHDERLSQGANFAYNSLLSRYFSRYLHDLLQEQLERKESTQEDRYQALKVYLMMSDEKRRNHQEIEAWFNKIFVARYDDESEIFDSLMSHVKHYLTLEDNGFVRQPKLVSSSREALTKVPLPERVYHNMKLTFGESSMTAFRLTDILSTKMIDQLERDSGKPISLGVSSFYTKQGYKDVFLMQLNSTIKTTLGEGWVYGDSLRPRDVDRSLISKKVTELYFIDFIEQWEGLIFDLGLKKTPTLDSAIQQARILSSAEYPVTKLLSAIQEELSLTKLDVPAGGVLENDAAKDKAKQALMRSSGTAAKALYYTDGVDFKAALTPVEQHFKGILKVTERDIESINSAFSSISIQLKKIGRSGNNSKSAYLSLVNEGDPEGQFDIKTVQSKLPYPFDTWLKTLSGESKQFARSGSKQHINRVWKSEVYRVYERTVRGRYPFSNSQTKEVSLNDFKAFFGFGGTMDSFYKQYLEPFVDTTGRRWKFTKDIGVSDRSLRMFQRAKSIREAFFTRSNDLKVEFKLKPSYLDQHILRLKFKLGSQELAYKHDVAREQSMRWSKHNTSATITFTPAQSARDISHSFEGDWGLFRLLDHSLKARPESRDDNIVMIDIKGNKAKFDLIPSSNINPFWSTDMEKFRCAPTL